VKFGYSRKNFEKVREFRYGENWPVVYILEDGREAYIGESVNAYKRASQHYDKPERAKLSSMYVIADDEYNKSATLDIEASLIKYFAGEGRYLLQNQNFGLQESDYYDRERYQAKFVKVWENLQDLKVVEKDLHVIENSDLFKFSPYKALTQDQQDTVYKIVGHIENNFPHPHLVTGECSYDFITENIEASFQNSKGFAIKYGDWP